jgi:hypothetical protein
LHDFRDVGLHVTPQSEDHPAGLKGAQAIGVKGLIQSDYVGRNLAAAGWVSGVQWAEPREKHYWYGKTERKPFGVPHHLQPSFPKKAHPIRKIWTGRTP